MDDLRAKVAEIEGCLQEASRLLNLYDGFARTDIGKDVSGMRDSLVQTQARIERVISLTSGFMRQIENLPASDVDLKPQITWLSNCMATILADFQGAEEKARDAISTTMNYECLVNDVSQDVAVRQRELSDVQREGEAIANMAEQQLHSSEQLMLEKESLVRDKNREIGLKMEEAARFRSSLFDYKSMLRESEASLAAAREKAKDKKAGSALGFTAAIIGVGLAPFTAGLSLAATAVGTGVGIGMAADYSDLKDQIASTQMAIFSLNSQISTAEYTVTRLTREKDQLQTSITQLQASIQSQKFAQVNHRSQISKANSVQRSVSDLQDSAGSITSSVKEMASQLLQLKHTLNQCAAALDEKKTELHVKTSIVDRLTIRSARQRRELTREKDAIKQATDALSGVLSKLPGLLSGSNTAYLELKPAARISTSSLVDEIPAPTPRAN